MTQRVRKGSVFNDGEISSDHLENACKARRLADGNDDVTPGPKHRCGAAKHRLPLPRFEIIKRFEKKNHVEFLVGLKTQHVTVLEAYLIARPQICPRNGFFGKINAQE